MNLLNPKLAKSFKFGLKSAIFITLLVVCYVIFMKEAIEKSVEGETWVNEKSFNLGFENPAFVICSSPSFKPSISEQYGFEYPTRDLFNMRTPFSEKYKYLFANKTVRNLFEDFTYANDLEFRGFGNLLKEGDNEFKIYDMIVNLELKKIITPFDGICHVIQARNIQNWNEREGLFTVAFKRSLDVADIPKRFTIYLTKRDNWQGDDLKLSLDGTSKLSHSIFSLSLLCLAVSPAEWRASQ